MTLGQIDIGTQPIRLKCSKLSGFSQNQTSFLFDFNKIEKTETFFGGIFGRKALHNRLLSSNHSIYLTIFDIKGELNSLKFNFARCFSIYSTIWSIYDVYSSLRHVVHTELQIRKYFGKRMK